MQIASTHDLKGVKGELKRIFFFIRGSQMKKCLGERKKTNRQTEK